MSSTNVKLRLTVMDGGQPVRVEELAGNVVPIKIGRLSSSHLRFEDSSVSRIHAVIEAASDGSFNLIDLGSASGTYVNGQKITKANISNGDELQFGNIIVNLEISEEVDQETTPSMQSMEFQGETTVITQTGDVPDPAAAVATVATPAVVVPQSAPVVEQQPMQQQPVQQDAPVASLQQAVQPVQHAGSVVEQQPAYDAAPAVADPGYASRSVGYNAGVQMVTTADGVEVEPFTLQGYYDDWDNYIPGYYDEYGEYHLGYGFFDEEGQWQVAYGYYDSDEQWIDTDGPVSEMPPQGPTDTEYYTEAFFGDSGGDILEVAMLWNDQVLSVTQFTKSKSITVGTNPKVNDFIFEHPAMPDGYELISFAGGYSLNFNAQMTGLVQANNEQMTLKDAIARGVARGSGSSYSLPLDSRTGVKLDVGEVSFIVHFTDEAVFVGGPIGFDTAPLPYVAFSAIAHILFLGFALTMPDDPNALELDGFQADDRFVQMMITPEQEEEDPPDWLGDGDNEEEAAKHKGEEGQAGKEDEKQTNKQMAIKGPQNNKDLQLKKAQDTKVAMDSGALAVLGNQVSSPFGNASESMGSDAIHALGNLQGDGAGNSKGFGGLGLAGAGRGGGGISERGIGMANVGTAGRGGKGRGGSKYGRGASDLGDKKARVPRIVPGRPTIRGSLDKEIIRRVVRQHRNEIRYCYEKQLQKNAKLAGQVKVKFTIAGTGRVISAIVSSSTLKNSSVEGCMTRKIRRWVFPEPKGGGIVIVNYPFNFSS